MGHQLHLANHKVKELIVKRGEVFERLQQWLLYVNRVLLYIVYYAVCMSSQIIPVRHDLDRLQTYFEQQQQKYDNAIKTLNDVSKRFCITLCLLACSFITICQWNSRQSNRMKRVGDLLTQAGNNAGRTSVAPAHGAAMAPPQPQCNIQEIHQW